MFPMKCSRIIKSWNHWCSRCNLCGFRILYKLFNDTVEELEEIQRFVAKGKNVSYEMLPYHRFGKGKYEMLGRTYPMGDVLLSEEIKTYIQKQNEKWRKKECQS